MAILHLFLCGENERDSRDVFKVSGRIFFNGTNAHELVHNALDTLCDSKLHHHGNHYQEKG